MRKVCMIAGGQSEWGIRQASLRDMFQEAAKACFDDNKAITNKDVDGLIVSTVRNERLQLHIAPLVAEHLGLKPKNICCNVEVLCASGSTAIILAYSMIKAGEADVVMVVGGEKLNGPQRWEGHFDPLFGCDHDWDAGTGMFFPPTFFGMVAKHHMRKYGTTEEQMAMVAVKNRRNGLNNLKAQFRKEVTLEKVLTGRPVASPIKLLDCCPVTDGAAAVILAAEDKAKYFTDKPLVYINGTAQATVNCTSANIPDWSSFAALKIAAQQAYQKAGIKPEDVDVAQVHDCFTISEILEYEGLGFCKDGEGGQFIQEGKSDYGGQVAVNTDGGLISNGHPLGGTGVRQGIEIMRQLRGDAVRQVEGARIGLTHNLSGLAAAHTIVVYGRE